mmetsp:Transcript_960/g.1141  ORF Transcript_960/g.1141 Transcript_960/m.1141 type:complete len:93 (+) Transcript_960:1244-1522(+)
MILHLESQACQARLYSIENTHQEPLKPRDERQEVSRRQPQCMQLHFSGCKHLPPPESAHCNTRIRFKASYTLVIQRVVASVLTVVKASRQDA